MTEVASQVDLLISLLVRFSEIGAVHYEPLDEALRFVFLLKGGKHDHVSFPDIYNSHLSAFHRLKKKVPHINSFVLSGNAQLTVVEITRDLASLSLEELSLTIELLKDNCGDALVREGPAEEENDEWEHNALIESLLAAALLVGPERLTGFRQDGKVLVFSIPLSGVSKQ